MHLSRILIRIAVVSFVAALLMGIGMGTGIGAGALMLFRADWIVLVAMLTFVYGLLGAEAAHALEHARTPVLMQTALIADAMSWLGALLILFYGFRLPPWMLLVFTKALGTSTIWAAWCAWLGLLTRARPPHVVARVTDRLGVGLGAATAFLAAYAIWSNRIGIPMGIEDPVVLALVLGLILTAIVGVGAMFIARLGQISEAGETTPVRRPMHAICPRCAAESEMQTGGDTCRSCGMRISVVIP
jgi:hypothetical protein